MMADGYTRASGKGMYDGRAKRPGNHKFCNACSKQPTGTTRLCCLSHLKLPIKRLGRAGFRKLSRWRCSFKDMVAYQEEVRDPSRIAEVLNRVITQAKRLSAPAQINIPRDYWTQVVDIELPELFLTLSARMAAKTQLQRRQSFCPKQNFRFC